MAKSSLCQLLGEVGGTLGHSNPAKCLFLHPQLVREDTHAAFR